MEKQREPRDALRLKDHKAYLVCCAFTVVGVSLFHAGLAWIGWGVMVASWAAWIAALAASFKRDVIDERR